MQVKTLSMAELALQLRARLSEKGSATLVVTGHSMVPTLRHGRDLVTLVPVTGQLRPGEMIFYQRSADQLVLHRIIRRKGELLICCGDHQYQPEKVAPGQVLAVVTAFERAGKSYSVQQLSYRLYTRLLLLFFPVRRPLLFLRKLAGKLRRRLR